MPAEIDPSAINPQVWVKVASALAAGICMGFGGFGPSLAQGLIGGRACETIGKKPENAGLVNRTMMVALSFAESSSIYSFVIALLLLFLFSN